MTRELHAMPLTPHRWWACHQPERPAEAGLTIFDDDCRRCALALHAAVELGIFTSLHRIDDVTGEYTGEVEDAREALLRGWVDAG